VNNRPDKTIEDKSRGMIMEKYTKKKIRLKKYEKKLKVLTGEKKFKNKKYCNFATKV